MLCKKIRYNAIAPGGTNTQLVNRKGLNDEELQKQFEQDPISNTVPMQRYAKANEMAETITWSLIGKECQFLNGSTISVDGGRSQL